MRNNPDTVFAFINSKTDAVQRAYYDAIAVTFKNDTIGIPPPEYYRQVNEIFESYTAYDNFLTFLVQSDMHCYTNMNIVFTADAGSITSNGRWGDKRLIDWLTELESFEDGKVVQNVCKGTLIESGNEPKLNSRYCEERLERTITL